MGYVVRHSTSNVNKTRRRGKVAIGTNSSGYNKTSTSGVYNGVPPVEGKHNFVMVASGSEPDFYAVTDEELINFVNGLGERNLIKNNPIPTSTTSFGTTGTHSTSYDSTLEAVRWYQTGYASWGAYHYNTSTNYLEFDTGSEYSVSFEWKYGDDHNTGTAAFFQIVQGNGQNTVFGNYTLSSNSYLQDNGWYRFTATQTPNNQGYPETNNTAQFRLIIGNQGSNVTDIYWRKLQLEKRSHTTDFANPDEVVSTVLEAQNYLLNRDDIIFTDDIKNDNVATDSLVLYLDARAKSSFLDNKPTENLVPSGGRTGDSALPRQSYHIRSWTYSIEQNVEGRDSAIRLYINPPGTDSTAPYADYGFHAYKSGGSQVGDVYTISMDYYVAKGNSSPAITIAYANGYKNPTSAQAASWGSATITDLGRGWYRRTQSATITTAGNTWWRGGLGSNNIETEAYIDNIQVELNSTATPFVDGTRSQNTNWYDLSGNNNDGTLTNGPTFSNGTITFDGVNEYAQVSSDSTFNVNTRTVELTFKMNGSYSNFAPLAVYANGSSSTNRVWLGLQNSKFQMHGWGTSDPSATTTISADRWYTCVWTYDKSTQKMKMYTNGILENDHSQTQGGVNGASGMNWYLAYVPGSWQSQTYSNVSFSSFKVYDKILSNSEVSQNYYGGDIVTNGLVYAMDAGNLVSYEEGSTTAYSMTGSITGTLTNGVAYTGSKGGAWVFDGSNDKITSSAPLSAGASTYTIEAIFKPASQKTQVVWEQNTSSLTSGRRVCMILISDGDGGFNGQSADRHDHMPYTVGEWHHWTITVDNSLSTNKIKMYANGELINQGNPSGTLNAGADSASIGSKVSTNTEYFDGDIGVVRVYNKVLTPSEVLQNYNAQKARFI